MIQYSSSLILDLIAEQTKITLEEDFSIQTKSMKKDEIDSILLKHYSSLIYVNGPILYIVIMSFEDSVLKYISNLLMDEEEDMMYASVASEMTNTFLGLAISKFPDNGKGVKITPPIIVDTILDIGECKNSDINNAEIDTKVGKLSINVIDTQKRK